MDDGTKTSTMALAMHKKWQEAATMLGGEGTKIVTVKTHAKSLIFALLRDAFKPMNITSIYKELRGVVPPPFLNSCLDMMCDRKEINKYIDGDREGHSFGKTTKSDSEYMEKTDEYSGCVRIKIGRNSNTTLYYGNQKIFENDGNGLKPECRNSIIANAELSKAELQKAIETLRWMKSETERYNMEPTNEDATKHLKYEQSNLDNLRKRLQGARELKVNEALRKQLANRIDTMASHWRKRKKLCIEFLEQIEDCTEGIISVKKVLSGGGPIEIVSDETVLKQSIETYTCQQMVDISKRPRLGYKNPLHNGVQPTKSISKKPRLGNKNPLHNGVQPTESFVGVQMGRRGELIRVQTEKLTSL